MKSISDEQIIEIKQHIKCRNTFAVHKILNNLEEIPEASKVEASEDKKGEDGRPE